MSDDLDDLLRRTMKTLDDQVPSGYFEGLPNRTLSRLESSMETTTGTKAERMAEATASTSAATGATTGMPPEEREEDSGLHDIRSMASSTKMRLSRRVGTVPPVDQDILASSSAGWKAVALPEPAKMVSLPDLADRPSAREIAAQAAAHEKASAAAQKAAAAAQKAARKATPVGVPAVDVAAAAAPSAAHDTAPVTAPVAAPVIGSRLVSPARPAAPANSNTAKIAIAVGLLAAAGAGAFFVMTRDKAAPAQQVAAAPPPAPVETQPTVTAIEPEPVTPPPVVEPAPAAMIAAGSAEPPPTEDDAEASKAKRAKGKEKDVTTVHVTAPPVEARKPAAVAKEPAKEPAKDGEPSFDDLLKEAGVQDKTESKPTLDKKSLSGGDFKKGIGAITGKAQACYSGTQGTATVKLTIAPSGQVEKATVSGAFAGTPTATCVESAVKAATFPPWEGGPQSFGYSFLLSE